MKNSPIKQRAPRNRTITLSDGDISQMRKRLIKINELVSIKEIENKTIHQDIFEVLNYLPDCFVDLVFIDPPYNLNKTFNALSFKEMESEEYEQWLDSWVSRLTRLLKPNASIYICGDWKSSGAILNVAKKYFQVQNRITFEREKGRGAKSNWKNSSRTRSRIKPSSSLTPHTANSSPTRNIPKASIKSKARSHARSRSTASPKAPASRACG